MSRKKAPSSQKRSPVIRVAVLTNPKTKRTVFARVTSDGRLGKRDAKHLGVKRVAKWLEVAASRWAQATKLARAGKGKTVVAPVGKGRAAVAA